MTDKPKAVNIADRVKSLRRFKPEQIKAHPDNWRLHGDDQRSGLIGLLEEVGFAGVNLVYDSKRHGGWTVIDGHLRQDIVEDGFRIPCVVLDVTDDEADLLLATHDPIAELATSNQAALHSLLESIGPRGEATEVLLDELKRTKLGQVATLGAELDESIADGISVCICPICKHEHAKTDGD